MNRLCFLSASFVLLFNAGASSAQSAQDGFFSKAQADRGRGVFVNVCANCHTRGQFNDGSWRRKWEGRTVFEVLESVRTTMPNDNPSSLSDGEYLDVIAYLLSQNGYPAGPQDANETVLKRVKMEPRSGVREPAAASMAGSARIRPPGRRVRRPRTRRESS